MTPARNTLITIAVCLILVVVVVGSMLTGAADIPANDVWGALTGAEGIRPAWQYIVLETRLPAILTALLAGASLALAGLQLQTLFANPLAGPSILGVSTGASLGVAVVMLALGGTVSAMGQVAVLGGALVGAVTVILALLAIASVVRSGTMVLIVGILLGYLSSSAIALLNFFASRDGVHNYVVWGLGSFSGVTLTQLTWFAIMILCLTALSMLLIKPMNALLLGERYARSAGVNIRAIRNAMLMLSGALTAVVTAWCGPIGFVGLIVPHLARLLYATSNHRLLCPATVLIGAVVGGLCQWLSVAPGAWGIVPVNAITPVIGVPVIVYIIIRRKSISYFN